MPAGCIRFFPGEGTDMAQHIGDLCQDETGFAHITLIGAFPQVFPDRLIQFRFMLPDIGPQLFQRSDSTFQRKCGAGIKISLCFSTICRISNSFIGFHLLPSAYSKIFPVFRRP